MQPRPPPGPPARKPLHHTCCFVPVKLPCTTCVTCVARCRVKWYRFMAAWADTSGGMASNFKNDTAARARAPAAFFSGRRLRGLRRPMP
jgi:hypothetical protein